MAAKQQQRRQTGARRQVIAAAATAAAVLLGATPTEAKPSVLPVWSIQGGTNWADKLNGCAADAKTGVVYVAGATWGDVAKIAFPKDVNWGSVLMDYYNDFLAMRLDYKTGALVWAFQDQSGKHDEFMSASVEPKSGDLLVAGYTWNLWGCTDVGCPYFAESVVTRPDLCAARISAAKGTAVWKWQGGTRGQEVANAGSFSPVTGQYVVAGSTSSNYAKPKLGMELRETRAYPYDADMAAAMLNALGKPIAQWQDGSDRGDVVKAVAHTPTGEVYLVGETYGALVPGAAAPAAATMAVVKLAADGTELWRQQGAGAVETRITSAATDADGNLVVGGYISTIATAEDFYVAMLNGATGELVWEWKAGTKESDVIQGVTVDPLGAIVVAGYTAGDFGAPNKGLYDFAVAALSMTGKQIWAWQDGSAQSDRLNSIALAEPRNYIVAGETWGDYAEKNQGQWDYVAMRLQEAEYY